MSSALTLQAETLQHIEGMAQKGVCGKDRVAILTLPGDSPKFYGVVGADGVLQKVEAQAPTRAHTLLSVDQIPALIERFTGDDELSPSVWYSPEKVTIVLDDVVDKWGIGQTTIDMALSEEFKALKRFAGSEAFYVGQKAFVLLLRTKLADALGDRLESLLRVVRSVEFKNGAVMRGEVQRGRESIDRSIEAEVRSAAGEIPDMVSMDVRVFADPALKNRFRCDFGIEVDTVAGAFALIPLGEGLTAVMDEQMASLRDLLSGLSCPVFYGKP